MKVSKELDRMFEEKRTFYATYIREGDPERLKVVTIDGSKFLGKIVDQGLRVAEVPDIGRHCTSSTRMGLLDPRIKRHIHDTETAGSDLRC